MQPLNYPFSMATVVDIEPIFFAPPAADRTRFSVVHDPHELTRWRSAWQELDEAVATPMETFDWISVAAATFAADGELEIVLAQQGGRVTAAAPLVRVPSPLGGRWHALNYHRLFEPAEFAASSPAALAELASEVVSRGRPLVLGRVFADTATRSAIEQASAGRGWLRVGPQAGTPWIPLDAAWATPEAQISPRRRSDLRRARKHAEQLGPIEVQNQRPREHEVDALVDRAFDVERRSWKGESGTALAQNRSGDFYRQYARAAARQDKLRIHFLQIGQQDAAMQIGVVHRLRYWVLKVGYDPQFQRSSPGILLMVDCIKQAVAEGLDAYELLGTVEPWIQVWTRHEHRCVSFRAYPAGVRGAGALGEDFARKACQRVQSAGLRVQHFFRPRTCVSVTEDKQPPDSRA